MDTPKVLLSMIMFSEQNVQKSEWYKTSVKNAVRCSLINFYAQKLHSQLVAPLEPWEGQVVADFNYRKILAKVEQELPEIALRVSGNVVEAQSLYDVLCKDFNRRRTLCDRYDKLWWYEWTRKKSLKKRIQKIDDTEIELFDFLNMALYFFEKRNFGNKADFMSFFS